MKLTDELKAEIDGYTYTELLREWRRAPVGAAVFQDESGQYWQERMRYMRREEQLIEDYGEPARRLIKDAHAWLHSRLPVWNLPGFDVTAALTDILKRAGFCRRPPDETVDIHARASKG